MYHSGECFVDELGEPRRKALPKKGKAASEICHAHVVKMRRGWRWECLRRTRHAVGRYEARSWKEEVRGNEVVYRSL